LVGTHITSWNREKNRIKAENKDVSTISMLLQNNMVYYFVIHVSICVAVYHFFGMGGLKFQAFYAPMGIMWLESVNLLEHYGL